MIRVTVELWPFGKYHYRKSLAVIDIINDGKGDAVYGNYDVKARIGEKDYTLKVNQHARHWGFMPLLTRTFRLVDSLVRANEVEDLTRQMED